MASMMNTTVIIMAGGLGKRMKSELPKVLHKVDGEPMLVRIIKQALELKPTNILIVVGKYKPIIQETLLKFHVLKSVKFVIQEPAMGTGHAIQCCKDTLFLNNAKDDKVLILSGDTPLVSSNLMKNMLTFEEVKIMTTFRDDPTGYGRVKLTKDVFDKIVEHKDASPEELKIQRVNCGIYAFRNHLLCDYLKYLNNNNAQNEYYLTDMIEILKNKANAHIDIYTLPQQRQWELTNVNDRVQLQYVNNLVKSISKDFYRPIIKKGVRKNKSRSKMQM